MVSTYQANKRDVHLAAIQYPLQHVTEEEFLVVRGLLAYAHCWTRIWPGSTFTQWKHRLPTALLDNSAYRYTARA